MPDERITSQLPATPPTIPHPSPRPGVAQTPGMEYRTAFRWAVVAIVALVGLCIWLSCRDQPGGVSERNAGNAAKPADPWEKGAPAWERKAEQDLQPPRQDRPVAPPGRAGDRPAARPEAPPRQNGFVADPPRAKDPPVTTTVYITNTGKKYHRAGCSYLRQSQTAVSLDEAIRRGYTPCSRCGP